MYNPTRLKMYIMKLVLTILPQILFQNIFIILCEIKEKCFAPKFFNLFQKNKQIYSNPHFRSMDVVYNKINTVSAIYNLQ